MEHMDKSTLNSGSKEKIRQAIAKKIKEVKGYTPRVGIFGSTGVGKSSLCNSLFGRDVAPVSNVAACTRDIQEIHIPSEDGNEGGLTIVDFPGVGETLERDKEYYDLYKENVAKLDLVVWVIKSDERAYAISQKVYNDILLPNIEKCPVVFFINQIDKIEPTEDDDGELLWDKKQNIPTKEQLASVNQKIIEVSNAFSVPTSRIIPTSVKRKFNISEAMETIIDILPKEKKYALYREAGEEIKTEKMAESAEKGVWDTVKEWTGEAWDSVKDVVVEVVAATVVAAGKKILSKLKFW
ncbi:50S ribosome-binding GTPase [Pectobacterium brasiliense]|uniref:GTPase family protein n=1 Tax=Pectobacterium brasiliense TaxID=180957 RepID=UPI0015DE61E2|nr:GTPase [Pectobacterium brasiliense]MBA0219581.1 50S ribosome-binding GTPase [Pectobacterium brasiliense]MBN3073213.1 50S ribosome-binding GTPase [Pectobacterium brasiliense]MBN3171220.1 50S ribosome-binding GTPase [Pectobacterium brasiliense]